MSFMENPFEALVTSARTTGQTVLDKDGRLKIALHNLVPNTDLSDAGDWTPSGLTSLSASGTSPSGKMAWLLTEDATGAEHRIHESLIYTAGNTYSIVFDAKTNGRDITIVASGPFSADVEWVFDLSAGSVSQKTGGLNDSASITLISDGYYRCVLTAEAVTSGAGNTFVYFHNGSTRGYAGDGVSGVYLSRPRVYQSAVHAPAELVPNGTFPVDTSDWTAVSNATLALNANRLHITSHTGFTLGVGSTPISTVVGETYVLSVDTILGTSAAHQVWVGTSNINAAIHDSGNISATTAYTVMFTATQATHYINLVAVDAGGTSLFDNVTCVQVRDDGMQLATDGTDFLETTDGPVYHLGRAHDGNGAVLGSQHFEGRTNNITYSNDFTNKADAGLVVTPNSAVSIDGSTNATTLVPTAILEVHRLRISSSGSELKTVSLFAKASGYKNLVLSRSAEIYNAQFDLSAGTVVEPTVAYGDGDVAQIGATITPVGGGVYFCTYSQYQAGVFDIGVNDHANSLPVLATYTGDGVSGIEVYGLQEESGGFATPYIPTLASAVARGTDDASLLTSSFGYRADKGSVIVEYQVVDDENQKSFGFNDGSNGNIIYQYNSLGNLRYSVNAGAVLSMNMAIAAGPLSKTSQKIALAYKENDFGASVDGAAAVVDVSGDVPTVTTLSLGKSWSGSAALNGYIKSFGYYPTRFADAILESESA